MINDKSLEVYLLCAEWCKVCRDLQASIPIEARSTVRWVDIEKSCQFADELEIENFPTVAVFRDQRWTYWGITEPRWSQLLKVAQLSNVTIAPEIIYQLNYLRSSCT